MDSLELSESGRRAAILRYLPAGGIDVIGGQEPFMDQRGYEKSHVRMKIEHRSPILQARTRERGFGRRIDRNLSVPGGSARRRRGNLLTEKLVYVAWKACGQQCVNPWQDGDVIG